MQTEYKSQALVEAAFRGDLAEVRNALSKGEPVDGWGELRAVPHRRENRDFIGDFAPLSAAAVSLKPNREVIEALLEAGAKINGEGAPNESTPLMWAAQALATQNAMALLDFGADPWYPDGDILRIAHSRRLIKRLLDMNPPPEALIKGLLTSGIRCQKKISWLVSAGADPNHRLPNGMTVLHFASDEYAVRALVKAGADMEAISETGPNSFGEEGWTPLGYYLTNPGNPKVQAAREIVRLGANVRFVNRWGVRILDMALRGIVDSELVKALIDQGADPRENEEVWNAFHCLAWSSAEYISRKEKLAFIRLFLDAGIQLDGISDLGTTPVFEAVRCGGHRWLEELLKTGADPNLPLQQDGETFAKGTTPLMAAIFNPMLVKRLLAAGADREARNAQGMTALELAQETMRDADTQGPRTADEFATLGMDQLRTNYRGRESWPDYLACKDAKFRRQLFRSIRRLQGRRARKPQGD